VIRPENQPQQSEGRVYQVHPLEGPACQVRFSEGRARRVRGATLDNRSRIVGHDKRVPPIPALGGTRLSGPLRLTFSRTGVHYPAEINAFPLRHGPGAGVVTTSRFVVVEKEEVL